MKTTKPAYTAGYLKSEAELFDHNGVATVMSKVTHMLYGVHGVDTMFMFC